MDHNTLEEIYQDLELCDEPEKYSEHYRRFIKEAYHLSLSLRKAGADDPDNPNGQELLTAFYETLDELVRLHLEEKLGEQQEIDTLQEGDPRLVRFKELQPVLDRQIRTLLEYTNPSMQLMKTAANLREHTEQALTELENLVSQSVSNVQLRYDETQAKAFYDFIAGKQDSFQQMLSAEQKKYLQGEDENSEVTLNREHYQDVEQLILFAQKVYEDTELQPANRTAVLRLVSCIQEFYYENMIPEENRYVLREDEQVRTFLDMLDDYQKDAMCALAEEMQESSTNAAAYATRLKKLAGRIWENVRCTLDTVRYDRWEDWQNKDLSQIQDHFQRMGMQKLMEEYGLQTREQFYLRARLESNPAFDGFALAEQTMELMALNRKGLPEEVTVGGETRNLQAEFEMILTKSYDCATAAMSYYIPDADGRLRYLCREEIEDLGTKYMDLNADMMDLCDAVAEKGSGQFPDFPMEHFREIREELAGYTADFFNAVNYINLYADRMERNTIRPFSIYDLLGQIAPNGGDGLFAITPVLKEELQDVPYDPEQEGDADPAEQVVNAVAELTDEILPELLRERAGGKLFVPLEPEKLQELGELYTEKEQYLQEYIREMSQIMDDLTEAELIFLKTVRKAHTCISRMAMVYGLLNGDEQGDRLAGDIDQYIEDEGRRKREEEESGTSQPSRYSAEESNLLRYAMNCRQMMQHDCVLVSFLLEDPQEQHGVEMLSRNYNTALYDETAENRQDISKIPWTGGCRDLSMIPEYRMQLDDRDSVEHIMQYASKNDWPLFLKVLEMSMSDLPVYMKETNIYVRDEDSDNPVTETINVSEMIRTEIDNWWRLGGTVQDYMEVMGIANIVQRKDGFQEFADTRDGMRIAGFLNRIQRNLENAGLGVEPQRALSDPEIPDGYNETRARNAANELFGELDRTIRHERMPEVRIPLAQECTKGENYMDVTVSKVRANTDTTSLENDLFYTTVQDFRASDFVGNFKNIDRNMENLQYSIEGLSEQEIAEVFSETRKNRFDATTERQIREARNVVRKVQEDVLYQLQQGNVQYGEAGDLKQADAFDGAKYLAEMADLQVMDYLCGIPKRTPEDLRLGFEMRDDEIRFAGITGADRPQSRPFLRRSPEEERRKFVQPEDMLVMTAEMYGKIKRWESARMEADDSSLTREERDIFLRMDEEVAHGFDRRLKQLLSVTEDPAETYYEDKRYRTLGEEYPIDIKPGSIRVLAREDFAKLHLTDLVLGKITAAVKDKRTVPARNLFDVMADLPQKCSDALVDKGIAYLCNTADPKFGKGLGTLGNLMYREQKKTYDQFLDNLMCRGLCKHFELYYGDVSAMAENAGEKQNVLQRLFGDGNSFNTVVEAAENLRTAIRENRNLVADEIRMAGSGEDCVSAERAGDISLYRQERLEYAQTLSDTQGHPYPEELPVVTRDPYLYSRSLKAMEDFRTKLQEYLDKRKNPLNEQGKIRYRAVLDLYNSVNESIAFYAALTGDTSVVPMVANEPENAPYSVVFAQMYKNQKEYEMTTPYYYVTTLKKQEEASERKTSTAVSGAGQKNNGGAQKTDAKDTQAAPSVRVRPAEGSRKINLNALMNSENPRRRKSTAE